MSFLTHTDIFHKKIIFSLTFNAETFPVMENYYLKANTLIILKKCDDNDLSQYHIICFSRIMKA